MAKIKITHKASGRTSIVSSADAKAIQSNPIVAKRYKFEDEQTKPSEPAIVSEKAESKEEAKKSSTKNTNK